MLSLINQNKINWRTILWAAILNILLALILIFLYHIFIIRPRIETTIHVPEVPAGAGEVQGNTAKP